MSQLVESIWIHKGRLINLPYHQARYNRTFRYLFGTNAKIDLRTIIMADKLQDEDVKCRIIYDEKNMEVVYETYIRKNINTVRLVFDNTVEYDYKYLQRPVLDALYGQRNDCDEIIIVKNGFITDAFYYNIIIQKNNQYFTPAKPLLKGVMRQYYLDKGNVLPLDITVDDLQMATNVYLINALNPLKYINIKKLASDRL